MASIGGAPIKNDSWNIDILLGGSQKCFSCPPYTTIMAISDNAWEYIEKNNYIGYDALLPFHNAHLNPASFPYTPCSMGIKGLSASMDTILKEGIKNCYQRHEKVSSFCRKGLIDLGISLWTDEKAINSPTVTAALVPQKYTFAEWKKTLADRGLYVGGSFGPMDGKVFRLGHMGTQANMKNMKKALKVIAKVLKK